MMMEDHALLFDDTARPQPRASFIPTDEVPRLTLDANQGGQIHDGTVIESESARSVSSPTRVTSPTLPDLSPALTNSSPVLPNETNLPPNKTNLPPQ